MAVLSALGCALMYAFASVFQQRGASAQPAEHSLRLSLLGRLLHSPIWIVGLACDVAGYGLQFLALGRGAIVIVQPLLVTGLLFALPISAAWAGRRLCTRDWLAAVLVCAGLAVFLSVADPTPGHPDVAPGIWVLLMIAGVGAVAVLVALGKARHNWQRAVLYSAAAGVTYGLTAAVSKSAFHRLGGGFFHFLFSWQPWVLIVLGVGGMVVAQSAFQAGSLDASLPTMSVVDPVVSIVIGAVAFGESIATSPPEVVAEVLALIGMSVGVFLLARSESVRSLHQQPATT